MLGTGLEHELFLFHRTVSQDFSMWVRGFHRQSRKTFDTQLLSRNHVPPPGSIYEEIAIVARRARSINPFREEKMLFPI